MEGAQCNTMYQSLHIIYFLVLFSKNNSSLKKCFKKITLVFTEHRTEYKYPQLILVSKLIGIISTPQFVQTVHKQGKNTDEVINISLRESFIKLS